MTNREPKIYVRRKSLRQQWKIYNKPLPREKRISYNQFLVKYGYRNK